MRIIIFLVLIIPFLSISQVGIGTTSPDPSSILHVDSSEKGLLIPNVSLPSILTTQLDGINTAAEGLLIYNTNLTTTGGDGVGYYYFSSSGRWEKIMTPSSQVGLVPIGSIIAWHGSLMGVGVLPEGWQLCDGSQITDPTSPLQFSNTPNLNGSTVSLSGDASGGRFLRGSTLSGTFETDQTNNLFRITSSTSSGGASTIILNQNGTPGFIETDDAFGDDRYSFQLRGVETRVTNMSVNWIVRIK